MAHHIKQNNPQRGSRKTLHPGWRDGRFCAADGSETPIHILGSPGFLSC